MTVSPSDRQDRATRGTRLRRRALLAAGLGGIAGVLAGCSGPRVEVVSGDGPTDTEVGFPRPPDAVGYPHASPDGNRRVAGAGSVPTADPVDLAFDGIDTPVWVVGLSDGRGSRWVAVDERGRAAAAGVVDDQEVGDVVTPTTLPTGTPPVLGLVDGRLRLWRPPADAAQYAAPTVLPDGRSVYIDDAGRLAVLRVGGRPARTTVDALPDARVLRNGDGRVALLTSPTGRYDHGVLGDATEAERVTTATVGSETVAVDRSVSVSPPAVIEGTAPIWADLTGSGRRDLIVTVSDKQDGARIHAYIDGTATRFTGQPIGSGNRWRHQLAVAPFGPDDVPELAVVKTPHIGGQVEFYRAEAGGLAVQATIDGYASHVIGSRNLDGAVATDADGDGRVELLVPDQARSRVAAVRRTADGVSEAWSVPLGGRVSSNLAAVGTDDGGVDVAVAREYGVVRVWPSRSG